MKRKIVKRSTHQIANRGTAYEAELECGHVIKSGPQSSPPWHDEHQRDVTEVECSGCSPEVDIAPSPADGFEVAPGARVEPGDLVAMGEDGKIEPAIPRDDGPTFEEYVAAGYAPEAYPPRGWAEKDSPGLREYREMQKATAPEQDDVPTKVEGRKSVPPAQ